MYGGKQKAKTMTFQSAGGEGLPFQIQRDISTAATANVVQIGDSFNSNVLHGRAEYEANSSTSESQGAAI
ncbi:hypothetical protein QBC36DRAFT_319993, partial [Triangularia setosa]